MTEEEKKISFMNRFFVFQKKRNVETNSVQKNMKEELDNVIVESDNIQMTKLEDKIVINPAIIMVKKYKKKQ